MAIQPANFGTVPFTRDVPIGVFDGWIPGPVSHPYPSVSNCRTETTVEGSPRTTGAPDCVTPDDPRCLSEGDPQCLIEGDPNPDPNNQLWEQLKESGVQLPDNYDMPSFMALEENTRLHLQAFKLGDVIIASCACEAQVDIIKNFVVFSDEPKGLIKRVAKYHQYWAVNAAVESTVEAAGPDIQGG